MNKHGNMQKKNTYNHPNQQISIGTTKTKKKKKSQTQNENGNRK